MSDQPVGQDEYGDMEKSQWKLYSLGVAAEAKVNGYDWNLEVFASEISQFADGGITNRGQRQETRGVDSSGVEYASSEVTSSTINAVWRSGGESNRRTCPNVEAGEEVIIYTYADTGKFFWEPRNINSHARKVETACYAYAADPSGDENTQRTPENSYMFEVSAHKKIITISTSDKNDEVAKFTFQLNGGEGYATLQDDNNQEITMNPVENRISMINAEDVEVHLIGQNLIVNVPADETHSIDGNETHKVSGNFTITVNGAAYIKAETATIESGANRLVGPTKIDGTLEVTGAAKMNGISSPGASITAPNIK